MRLAARRLHGGRPLREAMEEGGHTYQGLAEKTREVDPDGHGIGFQLVAAVVSDRKWSRDTTSVRSAQLIARALGKPEGDLFAMPESATPAVSTVS